MQYQINLDIEQGVLHKLEALAQEKGKSISELVSLYLHQMATLKCMEKEQLETSVVDRLFGSYKGMKAVEDEQAVADYLSDKYL